jgi:hypothetical protein
MSRHDTFVRRWQNSVADQYLKSLLAVHTGLAPKKLTEIVKAFRRWVSVDSKNEAISILKDPHGDEDSELRLLLSDDRKSWRAIEVVQSFIVAHWEEVRALERNRNKDGEAKNQMDVDMVD